MRINVTAQQFAGASPTPKPESDHRDLASAGQPLCPPDLQSKDVIHSFWVPEFGQKQTRCRASTHAPHHADKVGTYDVICTSCADSVTR